MAVIKHINYKLFQWSNWDKFEVGETVQIEGKPRELIDIDELSLTYLDTDTNGKQVAVLICNPYLLPKEEKAEIRRKHADGKTKKGTRGKITMKKLREEYNLTDGGLQHIIYREVEHKDKEAFDQGKASAAEVLDQIQGENKKVVFSVAKEILDNVSPNEGKNDKTAPEIEENDIPNPTTPKKSSPSPKSPLGPGNNVLLSDQKKQAICEFSRLIEEIGIIMSVRDDYTGFLLRVKLMLKNELYKFLEI